MQFTEEQAAEVKKWVVQRLEDISDADSDVLADYVLALIRSDAPDEEIRKASIENLEDFLKENTVPFVDELFARYAPKAEPPPAPAAAAAAPQQQEQPPPAQFQPLVSPAVPAAAAQQQPLPFNAPLATAQVPSYVPPAHGAFDNANSRKRTYQEGFQGENDQGDSRNRSFKTPRMRRGGGVGGGRGNGPSPGLPPNAQFPQPMPGFPGMPQGFPGFDQNDPMAAMLALQSMGFPQMPGLALPIPGVAGQPQAGDQAAKSDQPCPFYETNGICYMGAACPYKHGQDPVVVPPKDDEYDPTNARILDIQTSRGSDRNRGQGRGRGDRGGFAARGRGRAEFSHVGPNEDKSITTIVVENIPDDKLDEQVVRDYFSEFGTVLEVSMQTNRHLALVKFDDHAAAKRAWSSPKAVFDNRFVKVYWYKPPTKPETNGQQPSSATKEPFDLEAFERQQSEKQKLYEEKMRKRKEMEETRQALEKQREELLKKQQEEKAKLMQKLGQKAASTDAETNGHQEEKTTTTSGEENVSEKTKALRAQLAALEAEAKSLGIDPNTATESPQPTRGRGRGYYPSYRGRGWYAPRGRGYDPSYRGGYRGRGAFRGRGGVLRLDNRPKRVAVSGVEFDAEKDEALKQYLIGIGEYESIEPNPERSDSLIVAFKDRYVAEKLAYGPSVIPGVGKVQFSWVANPPAPPAGPKEDERKEDEDAAMEHVDEEQSSEQPSESNMRRDVQHHEVDYDVAEVDDAWDVQ